MELVIGGVVEIFFETSVEFIYVDYCVETVSSFWFPVIKN